MEKYFYPVSLKNETVFKNGILTYLNNTEYDTHYHPVHIIRIMPSKTDGRLFDSIQPELDLYGFPEIFYGVIFLRRKKTMQEGIHSDGYYTLSWPSYPDLQMQYALNIPLTGCIGTTCNFYDGVRVPILKHHKVTTYKWITPPKVTAKLELTSAHLINITEPHLAITNDLEDRWIISIRFYDINDTYEKMRDRIKNISN